MAYFCLQMGHMIQRIPNLNNKASPFKALREAVQDYQSYIWFEDFTVQKYHEESVSEETLTLSKLTFKCSNR